MVPAVIRNYEASKSVAPAEVPGLAHRWAAAGVHL